MRVVMTGATGFVGANLAQRLLRDGHEVHILVREGAKFWRLESVLPDLRIHTVSLLDADAIQRLIRQIRPDWVFHLAVYGAYSSQSDPFEIVQTNIVGTTNLLLACEQTGFAAFVNTGSSSEYGFKPYPPAETEWLEPNSYYAVAKASATLFCGYFAQRTKLPVTTLRLYSVYGPYEEPDRLMPRLIEHGLRGTYPPLVSPTIARDFVYINDVIEAYLSATRRPADKLGAVYNIGSGVQSNLGQVIDIMRRQLAIAAEPEWGSMTNRIWDTEVWVANIQNARSDLNWSPAFRLEDGLAQMTDWFRENIALYSEKVRK